MKKTNHLIAIIIAIVVSFLYFEFVIEENKLSFDNTEIKGNAAINKSEVKDLARVEMDIIK